MKDKNVELIAQTGIKRDNIIADVPTLVELATTPDDKQVMAFLSTPAVLGRAVAAPPGIPADRLAVLRKAFDDTMQDADFQKDLISRHLSIGPTEGAEIAAFIEKSVATPKPLVERVKKLLEF